MQKGPKSKYLKNHWTTQFRLYRQSAFYNLQDNINLVRLKHKLTEGLIVSDCPAARRRSVVQPPVAVAEQAAVLVAAVAVAVGAEVAGQPATGLPAVISSAEVTPSRSIRPCIPPTGSTTWTTFTTSSRPPRTVPTPRYTVITLACTCSEIIRTITTGDVA